MKKLMIALAVAAAAGFANAAASTWNTGKITFNGEGSNLKATSPSSVGLTADNCKTYLVIFGEAATPLADYSSFTDAASIYNAFDGTDLTVGEKSYKAIAGQADTTQGKFYFNDKTDYATDKNIYGAIIVEHLDANGNADYYSASTWFVAESSSGQTATMIARQWGDQDTRDGQVTTWQSVPEPTSGLLLLLGVAGLALRRRRA